MLSISDALYGWSPIGGDDEDVSISQDGCLINTKPFPAQSNTFLSPICPPINSASLIPPQSRSSPTTGVPHSSIAPSSDRRAQRNRNRDPSWIPRPRNAFIIFRCEYSREHSQGSQEPQSDDDSTSSMVKTLSKRAADAWKQLPQVERERYKELADKEREEHARLYPHYRFRPMKRQVSGTRKTSRERSQGPGVPSAERPPVTPAHLPSVLTRAPDKPRSNSSPEHAHISDDVPRLEALPSPEPILRTIDPRTESQVSAPLSLDYSDPLLPNSLPEGIFPCNSSSPPASTELYPSLRRSGVSAHPDAFHCNDAASGNDLTQEDMERAQALEAYTIGLHNYDLFSPFSFPEYY